MAKTTRSTNNRARILDAARRVIETRGAARLTMDAVAEEAAVSKGGVLYHFASKAALLNALLEEALADLQHTWTAGTSSAPGGTLAAWLQAQQDSATAPASLGTAVFANAAEDPEMLAPMQAFLRQVRQRVVAGADDPVLADLVFVAVMGLRFNDMFQLFDLEPAQRQRLDARLLTLAGEAGA